MSIKYLVPKLGRPTKYSSRLPQCVTHYTQSCLKDDDFPTIEDLAISLGVGSRTIYDWEKLYPDFSQTLELLRDAQRGMLIKNGLNGKYNTSFAAFLLKAMHGFSDSKPIFEATQNNYMDVSPEVLADALKIIAGQDDEKLN